MTWIYEINLCPLINYCQHCSTIAVLTKHGWRFSEIVQAEAMASQFIWTRLPYGGALVVWIQSCTSGFLKHFEDNCTFRIVSGTRYSIGLVRYWHCRCPSALSTTYHKKKTNTVTSLYGRPRSFGSYWIHWIWSETF